MLARIQALHPLLIDEQRATEERGYPAAHVHDEFLRSGYYRTLQPRRFGGYEFGLPTYFRLLAEIARGCPSTAWCMSMLTGHILLFAALFSEEAQAEAFGADGDLRACGRIPMGTATAVHGGWRINGRWDYCSGAPYATHFLGSLLVAPQDSPLGEPTEVGLSAIPAASWTMLDDWGAILGMRGSGSHSLVVDDQLLPEHAVVRADILWPDYTRIPAGASVHSNPMYSGRGAGLLVGAVAAFAVGCARAMLDEYEQMLRTRKAGVPPVIPRYKHPDYQETLGICLGLIDSAEIAVAHAASTLMDLAHSGREDPGSYTARDDLQVAIRFQHAGDLAWAAALRLFESGGSTSAKDGSRMQRYFRDFATIRTHIGSQTTSFAGSVARLHFGEIDRVPE